MSIVVEHEKRRRQILKKALDVFIEEGFEDATFQKIADKCNITRTTLYMYFRNRQEIFNFSIKQFMADLEQDILKIKEGPLSCPEKIKKTLLLILKHLEENRLLLSIVLDFFKSKNPNIIRRRTVRLRHIMSAMLIDGMKQGEIKKINVAAANDLFNSLFEAAIFRLVVLKRESGAELKEAAELAVNGLIAAK
ncbi:MAG: TetR/AcrR family transcriptional regulator [Treponema sp.]|jgi:AcrR family transcriptional regulator|nr:TetR/AcrR family transcriptional regulator [Treponema sp.]